MSTDRDETERTDGHGDELVNLEEGGETRKKKGKRGVDDITVSAS